MAAKHTSEGKIDMYKDEKILAFKRCDLVRGKIPVDIFKDSETLFFEIAQEIVKEIKKNNSENKKSLLIVPLGPVGQYKYLAEIVNSQGICLHNVTFINMDEYMWDENTVIEKNNSLSFKKVMYDEFYNKVDKELIMPECQRIFPDLKNKQVIQRLIQEHGGVDLCIGGIGINGHVAFNEPPENEMNSDQFCKLSVRVVKIARETIIVNSINEFDGAYEFMPRYAITIGFREILASKKIRLYCFRPWHKMVVRKALFYPPSTEFPVTLLRQNNIRIGIPEYLVE
jgi:glucosamine-6-phosphate deaminase